MQEAIPETGSESTVGAEETTVPQVLGLRAIVSPYMSDGVLHDHGRLVTFVDAENALVKPEAVNLGEYLMVKISDKVDFVELARLALEAEGE